jgi:hypothetical protein
MVLVDFRGSISGDCSSTGQPFVGLKIDPTLVNGEAAILYNAAERPINGAFVGPSAVFSWCEKPGS